MARAATAVDTAAFGDTTPWDALAHVDEQVRLATARGGENFDPLALHLTLLLYRVMGEFEVADAREFTEQGLNATQFNVLMIVLRAEEPVTMQQISRAVSVRPTRLTSVVDALCDHGFVVREINAADRRSFHLRITAEGEEFLARFLPKHWLRMRRQMEGLTVQERKDLISLLAKLLVTCRPTDGSEEDC